MEKWGRRLHKAVKENSREKVDYALSKGVSVDWMEPDNFGFSAMMTAMVRQRDPVRQALTCTFHPEAA